ncbi:MAG: translation initiation factor IF-3 [Hydrogenophilales bacterium]
MKDKDLRVNRDIFAEKIRLIAQDGSQAGIVTLSAALKVAQTNDLDLVEIAPMAKPPVCKIMDYGKFKYSEQKKAHGAKVKQKQVSVKEIKFRPSTDQGDYEIKLKNLIKFLNAGDKVKVTIKFRGREMIHQQFGTRLLERVKTDLEDYGKIEQFPKLEGRQLVMVLSPIKKSS